MSAQRRSKRSTLDPYFLAAFYNYQRVDTTINAQYQLTNVTRASSILDKIVAMGLVLIDIAMPSVVAYSV